MPKFLFLKNPYILLLLFSYSLLSCASIKRQKVQRQENKTKNISDPQLFEEIKSKYLKFETLYLKKVSVKFKQNGKEQSFRCNLRIKKDSLIWLSASKMGIEGFRVKLTPDSVFLIDRMHKRYFTGSYEYINNIFDLDLDFFIIQSILTNRLPEYGIKKEKPFYKNFQGKRNNQGDYVFFSKGARSFWKGKERTNKRKAKTIEILEIAPDLMRVERINICEYSGFAQNIKENKYPYIHLFLENQNFTIYNDNDIFPQNIKIAGGRTNIFKKDFKIEDIKSPFHLDIKINAVLIDKPNIKFPFSISSSYKKIND